MGKYNVSQKNFEKFKNGKLAVNCRTEEQAKEFVKWCFDNDFKWAFGFSNDVTYFNYYGKKTCYRYIYSGILVYSSKESNQELRIEILTFDEFMGIKQEIKEVDYKRKYEKLIRYKEYFDSLYGQGLEVANWHMNGTLEPLDNFIESAEEEIERVDESTNIKEETDYKREYEKLLNENQDLKEFIKDQEEYLHKKYCFEINELVKERNRLLEENKQLRGK